MNIMQNLNNLFAFVFNKTNKQNSEQLVKLNLFNKTI